MWRKWGIPMKGFIIDKQEKKRKKEGGINEIVKPPITVEYIFLRWKCRGCM